MIRTRSVRCAAVVFVLATSLEAQKVSFLQSIDARRSTTPSVAANDTGVYMARLTNNRFVLHKFDRDGKELWTSESREASWITAMIAVDEGAVYVTGSVDGAAPGQTAAGSWDTYVAKYDSAGNQLWIRQFGTSGDEEGGGIAADSSGVYVSSATWIFAKQSYIASVRKYSPDGDLLWTRDFNGLSHWRISLAADGESLSLAAGTGQGGKPWSNGQPAYPFLRRYSRTGIEQWTRFIPVQPAEITGLAADQTGAYAVLESFSSSGNVSSVRKYDANANELWVSPTGPLGTAVATDGVSVYLGGSVNTAVSGQCYAGAGDAFIRKFDAASGDEQSTREFGTQQPDPVAGLAVTADSVFILAGQNLARVERTPVADSKPRIHNECVLNAASNIGGGVVPGEIVMVIVTGEVTRLLFNGVTAPVLSATETRLTAVVPPDLAVGTTVDIRAESGDDVSEPVRLPVLPERLGVFSADGSGNGQAAIINEDGSPNSPAHPAMPGSSISVFGTGSSANDVRVAISNEIIAFPEVDGGAEDYRYYAPITSTSSAGGVLEINLRLPSGVPSGSTVPLHIMAGGVRIEQFLTMAIGK